MGKRIPGSLGFWGVLVIVLLFFSVTMSGAVNQWFMPNEDAGSFQLKTLRVKEIRAPQAAASSDRTLTIYSHTLSGTQTGGTLSGPTVASPTITAPTITGVATLTQTPVVLNSQSQFTYYSGETAGTSIYRLTAGKDYIVDPIAIGLAGVSLIGAPANAANNYAGNRIWLANTGASGYQAWAGAAAGTTSVYVLPYSAGTTTYDGNGVVAQTMARPVNALQGVTLIQSSKTMGAGTYVTLDYPGEGVELKYFNENQVSAYARPYTLN